MQELRFPNDPEMQKKFEAQERMRQRLKAIPDVLMFLPCLILGYLLLLVAKLKKL